MPLIIELLTRCISVNTNFNQEKTDIWRMWGCECYDLTNSSLQSDPVTVRCTYHSNALLFWSLKSTTGQNVEPNSAVFSFISCERSESGTVFVCDLIADISPLNSLQCNFAGKWSYLISAVIYFEGTGPFWHKSLVSSSTGTWYSRLSSRQILCVTLCKYCPIQTFHGVHFLFWFN